MADPLLHLDQGILSHFRVAPGLERRGGGAENDGGAADFGPHDGDIAGVVAGNLLLLVGRVVLFVDDDQAQVLDRGEDGRAGADDNARFAAADAIPLLGALVGGERGVQQGHAGAEGGVQLRRHGRSEADLRDQQNGRAAGKPRTLHGGQIHGRLARAGHAVQQAGAKALAVERSHNVPQRGLLSVVEFVLDLPRPAAER